MPTPATHWDHVYATKDPTQVSWYQPVPETSLRLIRTHGHPKGAVIDIGAGASFLVENLLHIGHTDITLLDVSAVALKLTLDRLGPRAPLVHTVAADVASWSPTRKWDIWHDRAVFHFLTETSAIAHYRDILADSLPPGGIAVVAAFHLTGPDRCSNLPTARYDATTLHRALGGPGTFELLEAFVEQHPHPRGHTQAFQVVALRKRSLSCASCP